MNAALWADAISGLDKNGAIFLAGACGEPTAFLEALREDPQIGADREFTGIWIPGVNSFDPTAICENANVTTIFATPDLQAGTASGRVRVLPAHYSSAYKWFRSGHGFSGAVFQVAPPEKGLISLGVCADFIPALVEAGVPLIGQINPQMPVTRDGPAIPQDRFSALIEAPHDLIEYSAGAPSHTLADIAVKAAELVRPGDTVQFGIGKLQPAIVDALSETPDLAVHGGMVSDRLHEALCEGMFQRGVLTGVALGSRAFYQDIARHERVRFASVAVTHDAAVLRSLESFVAINSVLEVDLYGQCNGEFIGDSQITGHGGLADFIRGANASDGGRSIVALPSTAAKGRRSRIVARLNPNNPVTIARSDAHWVVTEHGAVNLQHADMDQRAELLISIASPEFRDSLADDWVAIRRGREPA